MVLVIPLWAGLGIFSSGGSAATAGHLASHGHGGHGEGVGDVSAAAGAFIEAHTRPDGCVDPGYHAADEREMADDMGEEAQDSDGGGHQHGIAGETSDATVVYVQAYSYGYLPARLCLDAGEPYLFKLMAIDVTHGWTIQLGNSSAVMRLPPGVVVERELTFTKPGRYLVYCSYYCGLGHPRMQAEIVIEPRHEA